MKISQWAIAPLYGKLLRRRLRRQIANPIFIVGAGRSGTTVICKALNEHSRLLIAPGESPLVSWFGKIAYQYRHSKQSEYYRNNTGLEEQRFRRSLQTLCFDCVWGDTRRVRAAAHRSAGSRGFPAVHTVQHWGAKAFPNQNDAEGLSWLYPNVRFLYIFRNGIDVVHSMSRFHGFQHLSFAESCQFWAERAVWYDYLRHAPHAHPIRFEDFLHAPEKTLEEVLAFLGVEQEQAPVQFASATLIHPLDGPTVAAKPRDVLAERSPPYESWSEEQKQTFRVYCTEAMKLLNYPLPF